MDDKTKVVEREPLEIAEQLRGPDVDLRLPAVVPREPYPIEPLTVDARQQTRAVGQRATRPDGRLHGLGQTKYIDDLNFPGMLYARIKRAGIASARIKRIDTSAAEAMPGGRAARCRSSAPKAASLAMSSHCSTARGQRARTAATKRSRIAT